jgi:hypothetical protein
MVGLIWIAIGTYTRSSVEGANRDVADRFCFYLLQRDRSLCHVAEREGMECFRNTLIQEWA